jgi:hypothetical protein
MVSSLPQLLHNCIWANLHAGLVGKNCEGLMTSLSGINFKLIVIVFSGDPGLARLWLILNRASPLEVGPYVTGNAVWNVKSCGSLGDILIGLNVLYELVLGHLIVFSARNLAGWHSGCKSTKKN